MNPTDLFSRFMSKVSRRCQCHFYSTVQPTPSTADTGHHLGPGARQKHYVLPGCWKRSSDNISFHHTSYGCTFGVECMEYQCFLTGGWNSIVESSTTEGLFACQKFQPPVGLTKIPPVSPSTPAVCCQSNSITVSIKSSMVRTQAIQALCVRLISARHHASSRVVFV